MTSASFIPDGLSDRLSLMHAASENGMKQSRANRTTAVVEERTVVADRTIEFLRRAHPQKTADNVAADTGLASATVARWLDRGSAPSSSAFLRLIGVYGPEFVCAVMDHPPAWLDRARREERRAALRAEIEALEHQLQETAA